VSCAIVTTLAARASRKRAEVLEFVQEGHLGETVRIVLLGGERAVVEARSIYVMEDEREIDTEQPPKDTAAVPEPETPEIGEEEEPGAADYLKAAKDGAKNLENLEP
jgi:hypothetical protein